MCVLQAAGRAATVTPGPPCSDSSTVAALQRADKKLKVSDLVADTPAWSQSRSARKLNVSR